jgi:hypothetical protein
VWVWRYAIRLRLVIAGFFVVLGLLVIQPLLALSALVVAGVVATLVKHG